MQKTFQVPNTPIKQFSLDNGLRIVLNEDHSVPVVSVAVYYDVGSRNEREGRTGFAHLFEHMMFQGSENVPKAAHFQYISNAGGTMNGTTSSERTNYFETLPASQLPLALWLESDRMRSLAVTQENLDNQREAVKEEKRLRYDNQPYVNGFLRLFEMSFKNPANSHSTIGSMEDLDAATVEDIQEFFRIYYAPNNAVLAVAGDLDQAETLALIEKYFATIPSQPEPPPVDVAEPQGVSVNQDAYLDKLAPVPAFALGWKIPERRSPDFYALSLASHLLFEGESARLYQKLVKGEESVVQIQGGIDERRGPSGLFIVVIPKPDREGAQIRDTIFEEIRQLATIGPSEEEMEKLRNNLFLASVRSRQSSLYRAQQLAEFTLYDNDPELFNTDLQTYLDVTAEQIRDSVAQYLDTDDRVLLDIVPAPQETPQASPQEPGDPDQPTSPLPQIPAPPDEAPPGSSIPTTSQSAIESN
ncbi:MAG TPA: insulinase family protein [Pyrinomonadaceae bacterium]|nr:insulinase family protein [Pyrinomonadaceae bacterium]